ncbi:UNVERIFIED_CONTAM: TetR/AcrR family fatty acid metabolism transcriptional regulator [Brevibacillus sp. OAP136]
MERGNKGKETRKRILSVAAREFAEHGFHETKISTIVKLAAVTQPAFYLYFPSKDAIFQELVSDFRSRLVHLVETVRLAAGIGTEESRSKMSEAIERVFLFFAEDPHLTKIGLFLSPDAVGMRAELVAMIAENLRFEQREGYLRADLSMEIAAECIFGIIERLSVSQLIPGTKEPLDLAKEVVSLLMDGMVPMRR